MRVVLVTVGAGMLGAAQALTVVTPSAGLQVVADRTYTVEWTGADSGRFEIDLYYCGSMCYEGECGEWVTALCPYGDAGCPDTKGDYDIVMPEPMTGMPSSGYQVRVVDVSDESKSDCSDSFTLLKSSEAPVDSEFYGLTVTSPAVDDIALAGAEYTVLFEYGNGAGSKVDRFDIDLYMAGGTGDCGTYVTTICDKPDIGCKDSMGDYDIVIPEDTPSGEYSIRVGRFEDKALFGCSATFLVAGSDGDMSLSYGFGDTAV